MMKEQPFDGFVDNPDTREQQQAGFEEGGKIFDFPVTVLMVGVSWLVGNSDRHQRDDGSDQIERGVQSF